MNILFLATVYRHLTDFHLPYITHLQSMGHNVIAAGSEDLNSKEILESNNVKCIDLDLSRSPFHFGNLKAIKRIREIIKSEDINLIHVHTPIAAAIARVALKKGFNTKIIYTAHGFHFYKGAPLLNWILYYTIEKILVSKTDFLIVINKEDYQIAKKMGYKDNLKLINGVGISPPDLAFKSEFEKALFIKELNITPNSKNIIYVAELNDNKNHIYLLRNWKVITSNISDLNLLIVGFGRNEKILKQYVFENELKNVYFLGYRRDVPKLLEISDVICLLSKREGLPKSIMEGLSYGLPAIVSNIRGLNDMIEEDVNGKIVELNDDYKLVQAFNCLLAENNYNNYSMRSLKSSENFLLTNLIPQYDMVYKLFLKEEEL